jgi:kumamolisin
MATPAAFQSIQGSEHPQPKTFKKLHPTDAAQQLTVTVLLRRKPGNTALKPEEAAARPSSRPTREEFAASRGAAQTEVDAVVAFAHQAGLEVVDTDLARRSVVLSGTVAAVDKAFAIELNDYEYEKGTYRSHDGAVNVPSSIAEYVQAVVGLTDREVEATHFPAAALAAQRLPAGVPPNAVSLTPAQVATLYNFPAGDGTGETIGIYEMKTGTTPAGYALSDIQGTFKGFGNLPMPTIIDVPVDGTTNSGKSDGETGLDITVAGALAPKATIAVYFAGATTENMIHALQQMILPKAGQPAPSIISISYGWGPDDTATPSFSASVYAQFTSLFEDAATNKISVFVSSGDSGASVESKTQAQVSYPSSDVWVTACGGTSIGNINTNNPDEWVWNDSGATGGGVSARFPVPAYQSAVKTLPVRNVTKTAGRGVPDISGNASPYSGYEQVLNGKKPVPIGGTSAVAPLYAGLMARINSNLGSPAGFLNTTLYSLPASTFHDILGAPGPANNTYNGVTGYPAGPGWDACTGLGRLDGQAFQAALAAAKTS